MRFLKLVLVIVLTFFTGFVSAQHLSIKNVAGNGGVSFTEGPALTSGFQAPTVITADSDGNIYFGVGSLISGSGIYKIDIASNEITLVLDEMQNISGLAIDDNGVIYYSFGGLLGSLVPERNEYIYMYNTVTGVHDTLAGNGNEYPGWNPGHDMPARDTVVGNVGGIMIGPEGKYLYYSSTLENMNVIQKIDLEDAEHRTYRVAGAGGPVPDLQYANGTLGEDAKLNLGLGLAWDSYGNLYFGTGPDIGESKPGCYMIKQLNAVDNKIYHLAGSGEWEYSESDNLAASASIGSANSGILITASDELLICDYLNNRIRKIQLISGADPPTGEEVITTVAGTGAEQGDGTNDDGDLENLNFKHAEFANINPRDIVRTSNGIYFTDEGAKRIRRMFLCTNPEITSTAINRDAICAGDEVTMSFEGDLNDGTVWDWYKASCDVGGENLSNEKMLTVTVDEDAAYYAVGRGGCSYDVECVRFDLKIECKDYFNVFTPNNDGYNDFLEIPVLETYPVNTVFVYNRWGDLLQQIDNYDNETVVWAGAGRNNAIVDSGTYYFTAEANGELVVSGWVEVIK